MMLFLLVIIIAILITVFMVISADNEAYIDEKRSLISSYLELLKKGMTVEEIENVIENIFGVDNLKLEAEANDKSLYYTKYKWVDGSAVYEGFITYVFKDGLFIEAKNIEKV